MGKIHINATKNYGSKVKDALKLGDRIGGIYFSLADIKQKHISDLYDYDIVKMPEFPIYYLLQDNTFIDRYKNQEPIKVSEEKTFTPSEGNNKLICLSKNVDISFISELPLTMINYIANQSEFLSMIGEYYDKFYVGVDFVMTPTFNLEKLGGYQEFVMLSALQFTQKYIENSKKEKVILNILIDPSTLKTSNVSRKIIDYVAQYPFITGISITFINEKGMNTYKDDDYKNILSFLKELNMYNLELHLQYSGIKDIVFSVMNIESFSIGWFGTYRNFDLQNKGLDLISDSSFGRRVPKIMSKKTMSEIPVSFFDEISEKDCMEIVGIEKSEMQNYKLNDLETLYYSSFLDLIERNTEIEKTFQGDELIDKRCDLLLSKCHDALDNLDKLIIILENSGRSSDATKIKNENRKYVNIYINSIEDLKSRLFY